MASAPTSRLDNLRSLRIANLDGALATAFVSLTSGTLLVGFMTMMGASYLWINVLSGLPNLVGILQIPGGVVGRRFASYKRFVMPGGLIWRLLLGLMIPLPLLPIDANAKLTLLAVIVGVAWACNTFVSPVYSEWLSEMVPANSRGYFFSRRNAITAGVGAVIGIAGGLIVDLLRAEGQEPLGYSVVFGLGFLCAAISMALFMRMHDLPRPNPVKQTLRQGIAALKVPFADQGFRKVLIFIAAFVTAQLFAGNLFAAFAIEHLRLPLTALQFAVLLHAAGNVLSAPAWGFISDKYGNKPALILAAAGVTLTPLPWLLCVPGQDLRNTIIIVLLHIFSGASWAGVTLCQFNLVLATSKRDERATYIGAALALQSIAGGISPLLGGVAMDALRGVMPLAGAYGVIFVATSVLRGSSVLFLAPVREEGAVQIRKALRELRRVTPRGYRAMRDLTRVADEASRAQAIESVATEQLTLASDEIIRALHDPAPRVRRQAASALARLHDPAATEALIHQLVEHPDLVEEETIEALGEIGSREAVPHLVRLIGDPRSSIRRAVAMALGCIGGAEAVAALSGAAGEPGDPDLRRTALQALRSLGATEGEASICDALLDPAPSVRIAAAEAVVELNVRKARPFLHKALEYYEDEAAAELAYALGAVGTAEDLPLILRQAERSASVITRRRCLLGVARLAGVERAAYKLLLTDGMARDAALMQALSPLVRKHAKLGAALDLYASGDEPAALDCLRHSSRNAVLAAMAKQPVSEAFLVAVATLTVRRDKA